MKLIHLTDLHLGPPGEQLWGLDPYDRADRVLTDIAARHADAELCVITGDLADGGDPGAYAWLAERLSGLPLETVLMIGNHDDRARMRAVLPGLMDDGSGFVQGVRETDAGALIFLDTFKGGTSAGQFCETRQAWLRARLAEHAGRPVWIFMHHPPFDIRVPYMDRIKLDDAEAFGEICRGADIRHLFFGHVHRPCYVNWQGIGCTALPGTNHQVPLDRPALGASYSIEPAMYAIVHARPDGVIVHMDACLDRSAAEMDW